jgi:starch synthase
MDEDGQVQALEIHNFLRYNTMSSLRKKQKDFKQGMNTSEKSLPSAAYDNKIYAKFSKRTIEKKAENKAEFCKEFDLVCQQRQLLLGVELELSEKNGAQLLEDLLPGISALNICLAVRAVGTEKYQQIIGEFAKSHSGRVAIVPDTNEGLRKIFAGTDASFFFASGLPNEQLAQAALSYASLPIAPKSMGHIVEDYNPNQESGTGFLFPDQNVWSAFAAIVRAHENFKFPYDWKNIQKSAIEA